MFPRAAAQMGLCLLFSPALGAHADNTVPPQVLPQRPPQVGASGRPVLAAYGHETREVYRCLRSARPSQGRGADPEVSHYTDLDCPAQFPQRVAMLVWLSRVGGSSGAVQPAPQPSAVSVAITPKR